MNKDIWQSQLEFNKSFFGEQNIDIENLSLKDKVHWMKEFYFHINKEMSDLVNCVPHWKMHYSNEECEEDIIKSNLVEEYVDVFKYFMGLGQILGISYEEIITGCENKTEVVKQKYEQNKKFKTLQDKEVIVFDIDGVINNYPDCFLDWVNKKMNTKLEKLNQIKQTFDLKTYQDLKAVYRTSGEKRKQPINFETMQLMQILKKNGETIVLFTNRPVAKYKVIYTDTLFWLNENQIPFEAIYWSNFQKKEDIYKLRLKIKWIVEDNLDNAKNFNHEGYTVFLLEKYYNQDISYKDPLLKRVNHPLDILRQI